MRVCLILNSSAGASDRIQEFLPQLVGDERCELRRTSPETGARQLARGAVEAGFDRMIVAGGDGTVSQAVNGIAPDFGKVELAVLPCGTGNDLARVLGLGLDRIDEACARAFGDSLVPIDVVRIFEDETTSYYVNVANGGLGGRVAADVRSEDKQRWGSMAYWATSFSWLVDLSPYRVSLWLDDHKKELETLGVAVANGRYVGGGFPIAPQALVNDGLLDVTAVPALPAFELMAAGLHFTLGRERHDERIGHYRARRVRIQSEPDMHFSIDGETTRRIDATFEVIPSALRVVVGPGATGLAGSSKNLRSTPSLDGH